MNHPIPNQLPLFCRECLVSYEAIDDDGFCTQCMTPNVALSWRITCDLGSTVAYTQAEAIQAVLQQLLADPSKFIESLIVVPQ